MGHATVNGKVLPAFFIAAAIVPVGFGVYRVSELLWHHDFALRFVADQVDRLPLLLHVVGSLGFLLLAMLQILPGFRHRHSRWHRKAGRWAGPLGIIGGLSGVWMTLAHPDIGGPLLYWGRILSGTTWSLFILLGLLAVRRRDFKAHGRWMIRAFALVLPAGTLAYILMPIVLIWGEENTAFLAEIIQVAAWAAHLAVAEWLIRRRMSPIARNTIATV